MADLIGDGSRSKTKAYIRREGDAFCVQGNALEAPGRQADSREPA